MTPNKFSEMLIQLQNLYDKEKSSLNNEIFQLKQEKKLLLDQKHASDAENDGLLQQIRTLKEEMLNCETIKMKLEKQCEDLNSEVIALTTKRKDERIKYLQHDNIWRRIFKKCTCNRFVEANLEPKKLIQMRLLSNNDELESPQNALVTYNDDNDKCAVASEKQHLLPIEITSPLVLSSETEMAHDYSFLDANVIIDGETFSPSILTFDKKAVDFKEPSPRTSVIDAPDSLLETSVDLFSDASPVHEFNQLQPVSKPIACELNTRNKKKIFQDGDKNGSPSTLNRVSEGNENGYAPTKGKPSIKNELVCQNSNYNDSLEYLQEKNCKPNYKYSEVVRHKAEREQLGGYTCDECRKYYTADNLSEDQLRDVLKNCSRHRHKFTPPPSTPDSFWEIDFPETQHYIKKGYMRDENIPLPKHAIPKWQKCSKSRKRMKHN